MKILIVGLGSIAQKHVSAARSLLTDVQIFAMRSDAKASVLDEITNLYTWAEVYKHIFDFAIVSNPTASHYDALTKLIRLNIPLFIEKPLFANIGSGEEQLVNIIEQKKIPTYVACNLRFLESLQYVKNKISSRKINEVNVYCGSYLPDWRPGVDFRKVYSANREMGGGVHIDLIHELDYTYWFFGVPQKQGSLFRNVSSLEISAYDYANYIWEYNDFTANIVLNYYRKDARRSLEVLVEDGTYTVNLLANEVLWNSKQVFVSQQSIADTYSAQMEFFITEVLGGKKKQFNSVSEAYKILKLCLNQS